MVARTSDRSGPRAGLCNKSDTHTLTHTHVRTYTLCATRDYSLLLPMPACNNKFHNSFILWNGRYHILLYIFFFLGYSTRNSFCSSFDTTYCALFMMSRKVFFFSFVCLWFLKDD